MKKIILTFITLFASTFSYLCACDEIEDWHYDGQMKLKFQELNQFCKERKDHDLIISFLHYGRYFPRAIKVSFSKKELEKAEEQLWTYYNYGIVEFIEYDYPPEIKNDLEYDYDQPDTNVNYIKFFKSYNLTVSEIIEFVNIIYKSDIYYLSSREKNNPINGDVYRLPPPYEIIDFSTITRFITVKESTFIERNSGGSIVIDYLNKEVSKWLSEVISRSDKTVKPIQQGLEADPIIDGNFENEPLK